MNGFENKKTGGEGERLAAEYLENKGFQILARNWCHPLGELDLIALDKKTLVAVEVKARRSEAFGYPEEAVTAKKRLVLVRLLEAYANRKPWYGPVRVDVVAVSLGGITPEIRHLENIELG